MIQDQLQPFLAPPPKSFPHRILDIYIMLHVSNARLRNKGKVIMKSNANIKYSRFFYEQISLNRFQGMHFKLDNVKISYECCGLKIYCTHSRKKRKSNVTDSK